MIIDARPDPDDEFIVATAECRECDETIDRWCIPLEVNGETYPPEYLWRHRDGVVVCGFDGRVAKIAAPREGTVTNV